VYQTRIILSPQWVATLKAFDDDDLGPSGGTEYDKTVKEILDLAGVPDDRRPGRLHLASAIMRVNLKLAATMLHEFGHAFVRAHIEGPLERLHRAMDNGKPQQRDRMRTGGLHLWRTV
jgi:hypothetical protein